MIFGSAEDWLLKGKCDAIWRPDHLPGKCFGMKKQSDFNELDGVVIASSEDCRSVCCNLGDKCVSWQWQATTKECSLGGVMRLGSEATGTPDWCDPIAPTSWNGRRIKSRNTNGECIWEDKIESDQCFGLGPEQKKKTSDTSLTTEECQQLCCQDPNCKLWQEYPSRGCYIGDSTHCPIQLGAWEGQRKCIPGFCGGLEKEILSPFSEISGLNGTNPKRKFKRGKGKTKRKPKPLLPSEGENDAEYEA